MRRDLRALTLARHARHLLLRAAFLDADGEWNEAIGEACLAQRRDGAQGCWALRSLAAILWAESSDMPDDVGSAFAQDYDVRVRRALATALANRDNVGSAHVRDVLHADSRWSVRSILRSTNS